MEILKVEALPDFSDKSVLSIDIETTVVGKATDPDANGDPYQDRILSIAVSDGDKVWWLDNNFISAVPMLVNPQIKKVGQGFSYDLKFLKHQLGNIEISNIHCTLMAERLLTSGLEGVGNALDDILSRRLGVFVDKSTRNQFINHRGQFTQEQIKYIAEDVYYLLKVREQQLDEVSKAGMGKVLALENAVVPVIAQMELDGVCLDRDLWKQHELWYRNRMEQIKKRVCSYLHVPYQSSLFGGDTEIGINLGSTDQIKKVLASLDYPMESTREVYLQEALVATDKDSTVHTFLTDLLEYRGWNKMIGYAYHKFVNKVTGRIHADWNQQGARTGRLSCSDPNLQQAKARPDDPEEPNTREIFPPDEGEQLVIGDFAQEEPRILAEVSGDEAMREAARHSDMYNGAGRIVYGKEITKKDPERQRIKTAMLAHFYGASYRKIAYTLGTTEDEAKEFQHRLNTAFPKAKQWGDRQVQFVVQHGYMNSLLGRRCWMRDAVGAPQEEMWHHRNQALNGPMQMTGSDIGKEAMRRFYDWRLDSGYLHAKIRIAVHDELVVSCPMDDVDMVKYNLEQCMTGAMESICPNVKAEIEVHIADRWTKD